MKVTFKFNNLLSSVEGTESEIMAVLTAIGVTKPISWKAMHGRTGFDLKLARLRIMRDAAMKTLQDMNFTYRPGDTIWRAPNTEHRAPVYDSASWTGRPWSWTGRSSS